MADRLAISYSGHEDKKKKKYRHAEFDDHEVEKLARYFQIDSYHNLCHFLERLRRGRNF